MPHRTESTIAVHPRFRSPSTARARRPADAVPVSAPKGVVEWPTDPHVVLDAFLGHAGARLVGGEHEEDRDHRLARRRARAFLARHGFVDEDVRAAELGLYTTPQAVQTDLRRFGFSETAIRASKLVVDETDRPRSDWTGAVVLPARNGAGGTVDVLAIDPERPKTARSLAGGGAELTRVPADRAAIVVVESVFEAALLRRHGFANVVAIGDAVTELTPDRWREFVRAGVRSATLISPNGGHSDPRIRTALAHALLARVAPRVFVADTHGFDSPLEFVLRHGVDAFRDRLRVAGHAFGGKDYDRDDSSTAPSTREAVRRSRDATALRMRELQSVEEPQPNERTTHVAELLKRVERIAHPAERAAWRLFVGDVDHALRRGDVRQARAIADRWYSRLGYEVTPVPHGDEPPFENALRSFVADTTPEDGGGDFVATAFAGMGTETAPPREHTGTLDLEFRGVLRAWLAAEEQAIGRRTR